MNGEEVQVVIRTDKNQYVGGDTIYGSLYLRVPVAAKFTCLKLVIRGYELCEYDYQYVLQQDSDSFQSKIGQRKARKDILRSELKLVEYPNVALEGYFVYPFLYQLPHGLPGVFSAKYEDEGNGRVWQGVIKYVIGALLETPDNPPEHKLLGEMSLTILDSIECSSKFTFDKKRLEVVTSVGTVKTFFCIQRGDVIVSASLDRLAYNPGDQVIVNLQIDNNSSVDVSDSTLKVIRVIKLLGLDEARDEEDLSAHTVYDTIWEIQNTGCPKSSSKKSCLELDLQKLCQSQIGLPFTAAGSLVKCNYVIDVDVHIPWAPDVEVRQPLVIKPTPDKQWETWKPPDWLNNCVHGQVVGLCAVPQNILVSQSYSGMPAFQPIL